MMPLRIRVECGASIELQGFSGQKGGTIGATHSISMESIKLRPLGSGALTLQASKKRYAALVMRIMSSHSVA